MVQWIYWGNADNDDDDNEDDVDDTDENENDYEYNVDDNAVGLWIYLSVILAGQIEFKSTLTF